jgi:zinc transport system permease protein
MTTRMTTPMITGTIPISTTTNMFDDFLVRAGLAGIGVALAAGPLGSLVVWRRMAYFGDATAHASILGVALALSFDLPVVWGTLAVALLMAVTVTTLTHRGQAMDTTLGVLAHSALALGLVAISYVHGTRVDLNAYLFGDILAVSRMDLVVIWSVAALALVLILSRWGALLTATLNPDLAQASGLNPLRERLAMTLALALVVAVALKIVGALLIAALLIIPPAAARSLARTPEQMAAFASLIGGLSVIGGLALSLKQDTPAGPSIVVVAAVLFTLSLAFRRRRSV